MAILPFSVMLFMVRKGFIYTISADIYAFRLAFSGKKYCILHHFSLHLAPNCTTFCCKWPKIWCKRQFLVINIHSSASVNTLPFAPKQSLARIDFLRIGGRLVEKIAAIMLKLLLKSGQEKMS